MIRENLPELARESFRLSLTHCGDCRDYHATGGYLRAAGFKLGAAIDRAAIAERLASLDPNPRILIVGSADTGQVAAVASALAGRDFSLTLVDICDTPLKLCATFASRNGISLETLRCDVRHIDGVGAFDVILLHNFIGFIPADDRVAVLSGLRGALSAQGRLLLFQRIYSDHDENNPIVRSPLVEKLLEAMRVRNIDLPEPRADFAARLRAELISSTREKRIKVFKTVSEVEGLLRQAGFDHVATTTLPSADRDDRGGNWRPPNTRYLFDAG